MVFGSGWKMLLTSPRFIDSEPCGTSGDRVAIRRLDELSATDILRWQRLARRVPHPNPFQEVEFVLPAARHLKDSDSVRVISVEDAGSGEWVLGGAFESCQPSVRRPLPHLRAFTSPYSFLDDPLVDPRRAASSLALLFETLSSEREWHGMRFRQLRVGRGLRLWEESGEAHGLVCFKDRSWHRPELDLRCVAGEDLLERCSRSRRNLCSGRGGGWDVRGGSATGCSRRTKGVRSRSRNSCVWKRWDGKDRRGRRWRVGRIISDSSGSS
jgi:hypothetical protein